jgi:Membrane protein involved in the export of O-antigen and teichoic acid
MTKFNSDNTTNTKFIIPPRAGLLWGAIARWFSMGVSVLLGLIITPIIIRILGKELYGLWGLAASFVGFYGLFDFGLRSAISRFFGNAIGAKDINQFNRVASTGKCLLTAVSLLIIVFAVIIIRPAQSILRIPEQYSDQFRWLILLSATNITLSMMMAIYGAALEASEDFLVLSFIGLGSSVVRSIGGLTIVLMGKGVIGLAVVSVITTSIERSVVLWRCRKRFPQLNAAFSGFDMRTSRSLFAFSFVAYMVSIAAVLRSQFDVMLVTRFGGLGQAGFYALSCTVFRYFFNAVISVAGITWPRLNNLHGTKDRVRLQEFFQRASHITAACASLLTGLLVGLAPVLFRLWVGRGYEESATVLQILVAGYFLDLATNPGIGSLYATARHKYFAVQTTIEGIASFALAFILGAKYGMKGVALGIVIPITLIKVTIQPWYVTRNLGINLASYWFKVIGLPSLSAAIFASGLLPAEYCIARWGWWMLPVIILSAMVIPCMILWMFVLDRSDRDNLVSRFRHIYEVICLRNRFRVFSALQSESKDAS